MKQGLFVFLAVLCLSSLTFADDKQDDLVELLLEESDPKVLEYLSRISQHANETKGIHIFTGFRRYLEERAGGRRQFIDMAKRMTEQHEGTLVGLAAHSARLQYFQSRGQSFLAAREVEEALERNGEGFWALWLSAWLCEYSPYRQKEFCCDYRDLLEATVQSSYGELETLRQMSMEGSDNLLGRLATKAWLEGLELSPGAFPFEVVQGVNDSLPRGPRRCYTEMALGDAHAAKGQPTQAINHYVQALEQCPEDGTFNEITADLSQAFDTLGQEEASQLALRLAPGEESLEEILEGLTRMYRADRLRERGQPEKALQEYRAIVDECLSFSSAETSSYLESLLFSMLMEKQAELVASHPQMQEGADASTRLAILLHTSGDWEAIERFVKEHTNQKSLARILFSHAQDEARQGKFLDAERLLSLLMNKLQDRHEAFQAAGRLIRIKLDRFHLQKYAQGLFAGLKISIGSDSIMLGGGASSASRLEESQADLVRFLQETETLCFEAKKWNWAEDLADTIYRTYVSLGIAGSPKDLFFRLLKEDWGEPLEGDTYERLVEKCRKYEHYGEALKILKEYNSIVGQISQEMNRNNRMKMVDILAGEGRDHVSAIAICRELIAEATGTPAARPICLRLGKIAYEGRDYGTAIQALHDYLSLTNVPRQVSEANELLSLAYFRTGDYPKARALFASLVQTPYVSSEQAKKYRLLDAYSYLYRQEYKEACKKFENFLETYPEDSRQREISRLAGKLRKFKE